MFVFHVNQSKFSGQASEAAAKVADDEAVSDETDADPGLQERRR